VQVLHCNIHNLSTFGRRATRTSLLALTLVPKNRLQCGADMR
jgi:hypothetical protein